MLRQVITVSVAAVGVLGVAGSAAAKLNEFSVADGYQSPFSTPVWTYNSLWTFDGGAIGNNYVAQHGYGTGFAFNEPYALVLRNDNPSGNYRFSYQFEPFDLAGHNPSSLAGQKVSITFDTLISAGGSTPNNQPMAVMAFGGTRAAPAMSIGFSDSDRLMYSDASNNLTEYLGYSLGAGGWERITLTFDFAAFTYDLVIQEMTGNTQNASNTWTPVNTYNVVSNQPFANSLTSLNNLWFETFTDPESNGGWHKWFLDNFDSAKVPAPGAAAAGALFALCGLSRRRRSAAAAS